MFGDVDRRAAIFAAQSGTLADAQEDEQDRSEDADLFVGWEQADRERRAAHQADRGEERGLSADSIAHRTKDDGAQRTEGEADREQGKRGNQGRRRVEPGEKNLRDDGGQ